VGICGAVHQTAATDWHLSTTTDLFFHNNIKMSVNRSNYGTSPQPQTSWNMQQQAIFIWTYSEV